MVIILVESTLNPLSDSWIKIMTIQVIVECMTYHLVRRYRKKKDSQLINLNNVMAAFTLRLLRSPRLSPVFAATVSKVNH